jgi:hypothetical protein
VDNEGIVTAINWVQFCLQNFKNIEAEEYKKLKKEFVDFDRILLIRIEPTPIAKERADDSKEGLMSWVRWVTGPVEAIFNVRSTSQAERGNLESDLAYWTEGDRWQQRDQDDDDNESSTNDPSQQDDGKSNSKNVFLVNKAARSFQDAASESVKVLSGAPKSTDVPQERQWGTKQQWDEKVKKLRSRIADGLKKKSNPGGINAPFPTLTSSEILETQSRPLSESKLVVLQIQFPSFDQPVPLNWKLSKEQKLWYTVGWETCAAPGTIVRKTLDQYFTPSQDYRKASFDNE